MLCLNFTIGKHVQNGATAFDQLVQARKYRRALLLKLMLLRPSPVQTMPLHV
jgi:hypothetical protein